jgi:hypothetical protein
VQEAVAPLPLLVVGQVQLLARLFVEQQQVAVGVVVAGVVVGLVA